MVLEAIKSGVIESGERLVERDVAARFGVSRAPVRDAIHRLEKLGVIERRPPRGVYVRSWSERDATEILLVIDALIYMSVQLSPGRLTAEDLRELEGILEQTRAHLEAGSADLAVQLALDMRFHTVIARASGNQRLIELLKSLSLPIELYPESFRARVEPPFSLKQHSALLETLRRGDRESAVACVVSNFGEGLHDPSVEARRFSRGMPPTTLRSGPSPRVESVRRRRPAASR
jgi:DNA-binding GntR family transcriptional regulator